MKKIKYYVAFLMAVVMIMGFAITSYASEGVDLTDPSTYPNQFNNDYYFCFKQKNESIFLVQFKPASGRTIKDYILLKNSEGVGLYLLEDGVIQNHGDSDASFYSWYYNPDTLAFQASTGTYTGYTSNRQWVPNGSSNILYSFNNVYNYEDGTFDENDYFFRFPLFQKAQIWKIAEQMEMAKVLDQILMILPIGLVCLVGYLGLRKALSILQNLLHQA